MRRTGLDLKVVAVPSQINESVAAIAELNQQAEQQRSWHQRVIERIASGLGRPGFLYTICVVVLGWVAANLAEAVTQRQPFDRPPFFFLQGLVALVSLLVSTMVLIAQNRQLKLAERRSHLDLQVNLLTERKIAKAIALLEELRRDLPNVRDRSDPEANAMSQRVDPQAVAAVLERTIEGAAKDDEEPSSSR